MKFHCKVLLLIILPSTSWAQLAKSYNDLMMSSYEKGEYRNAIEWGNKALIETVNEYGEQSSDYLVCIDNLAILNKRIGNFSISESHYKKALEIRKKISGEENPNYANSLFGMAGLHYEIKNYLDAEKEYRKCIEIQKKVLGEDHSDYSMSLGALGLVYDALGRYSLAEQLEIQALKIRRKAFGEYHEEYANSLNNLALIYYHEGKYYEAEPLYRGAIEINKKALGEWHPDYAQGLSNMATLYQTLGNYSKAEEFYKQALNIYDKVLDKNHPKYSDCLNNLAKLYLDMGEYFSAAKLFKQLQDIYKKNHREEFPEYAICLNNLATLYENLDHYADAVTLYKQALEVTRKTLGENHNEYANRLNNLAEIYLRLNDFSKVESLYQQSLEIKKRAVGEEHPEYTILLNNLGSLYEKIGNEPSAYFWFSKARNTLWSNAQKNMSNLSELERGKYIKTISNNFEAYQSFNIGYTIDRSVASKDAFDIELCIKGLLLNSDFQMRQNILSSENSVAIEIFDRWSDLTALLSKQYSLPSSERILKIDSIEEQANLLEKELSKISGTFTENQSLFTTSSKDVYQKLKANEVALEFGSYQYYQQHWTDSTFYCAYLLRGGDTVIKQIFLFEQRQIDSLLQAFDYSKCTDQDCINQKINNFHTLEINGEKIYKLIWEKLEPYLKGVSTVYYSPSGSLLKISFAAIPTSDNTLLSDKYHLIQLNSTREIALESFKPAYVNDTSSIALFGGIKYDMDTTALKNATATYHKEEQDQSFAFASRSYTADSFSRGTYFGPLPATLEEVEFIKPMFKKSNLFTGTQATEEAFKSLQGKQAPDILHLATHGFFFKGGEAKKDHEGKIREFEYSNDPLIRSGLMMAGGNLKWKGQEIPENLEDGILTAKEVAALNLYNTKLVVLSACETGLGDIKGSEGVYGLQRAFKAAGADYLLMSLWSVPDKPTAEFMQTFYSKLKTGSDIQTAFEQTQTAMKLLYRYEPYNWAGFVLVR